MLEAAHFTAQGSRKGAGFALPEEFFDGTVNEPAMHQAVKVFLGNQRQGTHATKTRSFVSGGNRKPWKQKGTGRARQGSIRSPQWRGGGIVFGPSPRDYRTEIPRKLKQLARRSALNARARENAFTVVEQFDFSSPKTSRFVELLEKLGVAGRKVLVLTHGVNEALYLSARNIGNVRVMHYAEATAYEVLWSDVVVVEEAALSGEPPVPFVRAMVPSPKEPRAPQAPRAAKPRAEKRAPSSAEPKAAAPKAEKAAPPKGKSQKRKAEGKAKATHKAAKKKSAPKAGKPAKAKPAAKKPAPKKKGDR